MWGVEAWGTMGRGDHSGNSFVCLFIFGRTGFFIASRRLSLVRASRGYSLIAHGLIIAMASLVVEHRLWGAWA